MVDYQVDSSAGRLAAIDVSPATAKTRGQAGQDGPNQRIPAQRIQHIGRHAIILSGRPQVVPPVAFEPSEPDPAWLDAASLDGLEVLGDDGTRCGRLVDACLDPASLGVEAYLLSSSVWKRMLGRHARIEPGAVRSCSRELMVLSSPRPAEAAPAAVEAPTLGFSLPLKPEDRLPEAGQAAAVPDGHTVGSTH